MSRFKAVGFDYGGVIGGGATFGVDFEAKISGLLGLSREDYLQTYYSMNYLIQLGEVATWHEFWKLFLAKVGQPEKLDALMVINEEARKLLENIDTKMVELVDQIKANGYKVGLLSNNTIENGSMLRAKGLDKHFDVFHVSAETKLMKPRPETFKYFAQELVVNPQELVFIDDSEKSLSTAEECGFTPILFRSRSQLEQELHELDIL